MVALTPACTSEIGDGATPTGADQPANSSASTGSTGLGASAQPGTSTSPGTGTGDASGVSAEPSLFGEDFAFGGGADISITVGGVVATDPNDPTSGDPVESDVGMLVSCDAARGTGDLPLIDDFEDTDDATLEQDGRAGGWYSYNSDGSDDHVLEYVEVDGSPGGGARVLHTSGSDYSWAGIGFGLRWGVEDDAGLWQECLYDASAYVGVRFWARGNGVTVRFSASQPEVIPIADGGLCDTVEMSCWESHGVDLTFGPTWQQRTVLFSEMESSLARLGALDATRIRTMQFDIPENENFEFWIDDLTFIVEGQEEQVIEEVPPEEPEDGDAG